MFDRDPGETQITCPTKKGKIPAALSEESHALDNLDNSLGLLYDKLHTVRNLEEPAECCPEPVAPPYIGSSVFHRIKESTDRINDLNAAVAKIIAQVQL